LPSYRYSAVVNPCHPILPFRTELSKAIRKDCSPKAIEGMQ